MPLGANADVLFVISLRQISVHPISRSLFHIIDKTL